MRCTSFGTCNNCAASTISLLLSKTWPYYWLPWRSYKRIELNKDFKMSAHTCKQLYGQARDPSKLMSTGYLINVFFWRGGFWWFRKFELMSTFVSQVSVLCSAVDKFWKALEELTLPVDLPSFWQKGIPVLISFIAFLRSCGHLNFWRVYLHTKTLAHQFCCFCVECVVESWYEHEHVIAPTQSSTFEPIWTVVNFLCFMV